MGSSFTLAAMNRETGSSLKVSRLFSVTDGGCCLGNELLARPWSFSPKCAVGEKNYARAKGKSIEVGCLF